MERLLAAYRSAENATLNPLSGLAFIDTAAGGTPATVGPYRILSILGEGGMGVVYEAEQAEPLRRVVALKILKPGMDSRRVVTRFLKEQQALAKLDHPYIAKVFEAGHTAQGLPYFAMERVEGRPLLACANARRLSVPERIDLFIRVCEAVQHAHQKGMVHRDLKPSNILVSDSGPNLSPRVIDFGIARAVSTSDDGETRQTEWGQALGTPVYMSPEQATFGMTDVDTRSDIYSLGVVLCELLCGQVPAEPGSSGYAAFLGALAKAEVATRLPSELVPTSLQAANRLAEERGEANGVSLVRTLRGDLDAIVRKALESSRERRYQTAAALADDLQRYRKAEPVRARRPSTTYRIERFLRRHRVPALAAGLALLAILGGAVASAAGYLRALRAEQASRLEAASARQTADFVTSLFAVADPSESRGNTATVREVLERGESTVANELGGQPALQGRLLGTLAGVHFSLGLYGKAETIAGQALQRYREAGAAAGLEAARASLIQAKAQFRRHRLPEAQASALRALDLRTAALGKNHADVAEVWNELGAIDWIQGKFDEARKKHRTALTIYQAAGGPEHVGVAGSMRGLGIVALSSHQYQESLDWHQKALPIYTKRYGREHPRVADSYDSIGLALESLKRSDEAIENIKIAMALREKILGATHESIAYSHLNLGRVYARAGRLAEARQHYQLGLEIRRRALGPEHPLTGLFIESIALLHIRQGDTERGVRMLQQALAINLKAFGPTHEETVESQRNLLIANLQLKRYDAALDSLREVLAANPPKYLDVDLDDPDLSPLTRFPAFRELQAARKARTPPRPLEQAANGGSPRR
ncbi:MAG: serine/threonine-protein kinase [Bryobacterales bacterium]|nr:serine/threonine-protein kinase [Bryobacterales bacterium]